MLSIPLNCDKVPPSFTFQVFTAYLPERAMTLKTEIQIYFYNSLEFAGISGETALSFYWFER
jgi:hypothetical protein